MAITTFTSGQVLTAAQMNAVQGNDYNQTVSTKTASYTLVAADKGTRVVMNSASSTTITVNTSLFAAGDTLVLQNIGAGVCTVTAGTATVSSAGPLAIPQYGSGTLYFTSAGAAIYFPSAVTTSSGALTYIGGGALTAGASETAFTNVFSSTYRNYLVTFNSIYATSASVNFGIQLSGTTTGYEFGAFRIEPTAAAFWQGSASTSFPRMGNAYNSATTQATTGYCWIFDPQTTNANKRFQFQTSVLTGDTIIGYGALNSTTQYTALKFIVTSNSFAAGNVFIYGLAKS